AREHADDLLDRCGRDLKTALVTHLAGVVPDEARTRLYAVGGHLRLALTPPAAASEPAADLLLGIDGGGTHTVALLARADAKPGRGWVLVGRGEGGPSNLHAGGTGKALAALDEVVDRAFTDAGLGRRPVAAVCLGLAGAGRADDR